jgi:hypothetical protein
MIQRHKDRFTISYPGLTIIVSPIALPSPQPRQPDRRFCAVLLSATARTPRIRWTMLPAVGTLVPKLA